MYRRVARHISCVFFFNDTATTEIYTLSLHDALPIYDEALRRGFVSPYATSTFNEDYAETVAFILFDDDFFDTYIEEDEDCNDPACEERNEGRTLIQQKFNSVIDHYQQSTGVDLLEVRARIQERL